VDKKDGTIYIDLMGNFPLCSMDGMQTVFIVYDWTSNAIIATPITDAKDETMIAAFCKNIEYLTKREFKPTFSIMDNVTSKFNYGLHSIRKHGHPTC